MTDGSVYETRSTWGKEGDTLVLSVDPLVHSAWTKSKGAYIQEGGSAQKFQKRFGKIKAISGSTPKKDGASTDEEKEA